MSNASVNQIQVHLRSPLSTRVGSAVISIDGDRGANTVGSVVRLIQERADMTALLFVSVNGELRFEADPVSPGDDVVAFLPIAGG